MTPPTEHAEVRNDTRREANLDPSPTPLEEVEHSPVAPKGIRGTLVNLAAPTLFIVAALGIGAVLINTPPHVPKSPPEATAPVVGLGEMIPEDVEVFIEAYGTVRPARETRVMPEVGGRLISLNKRLEPGGILKKGETLFEIDPTDYRIVVEQAKANLEIARHETSRLRARIDMIRGRVEQLEAEIDLSRWNTDRLGQLTERDSAGQSESRDASTRLESQLAQRKTLEAEIAEQQSAVEAAGAGAQVAQRRLETAELALSRTVVTVPYDAMVVSEGIEVGQLVSPQSTIATLAATGEFWVEASIPVRRLSDVRFAVDHPDDPSRVTVTMTTGGESIERHGVALRSLGRLDPLGRMARALVSITDPLGLAESTDYDIPRVLLGSYVRLSIESGLLQDVYAIPRKALRENDRVWVRDASGLLAIRPITIVWRRHEDVLARNGFEPGDQLITTHLASVIPGMPLRVREVEPISLNPPS
jgi:multidrug efflux pump subunit AcrA (membrane-fusion protein)